MSLEKRLQNLTRFSRFANRMQSQPSCATKDLRLRKVSLDRKEIDSFTPKAFAAKILSMVLETSSLRLPVLPTPKYPSGTPVKFTSTPNALKTGAKSLSFSGSEDTTHPKDSKMDWTMTLVDRSSPFLQTQR